MKNLLFGIGAQVTMVIGAGLALMLGAPELVTGGCLVLIQTYYIGAGINQ